ncbi:unnamed protein product, partial [Didymodactylos carnosus]
LDIIWMIYNSWLKEEKRAITMEQRNFLQLFLEKHQRMSPLFVKLIFDLIIKWHSYDKLDEALFEIKDVNDCIVLILRRMQTIHNSVFFSRALSYISAFKNGITQTELEDLLSLDDQVLESVFEYFLPPVKRIPPLLWTRLRNDLEEYVIESRGDGVVIMKWFYRKFRATIKSEYGSPSLVQLTSKGYSLSQEFDPEVIRNIIYLYLDKFKDRKKEFCINDQLRKKYGLQSNVVEADRLVMSQATEFCDSDGVIQYNRRKLKQLPHFLKKLSPNEKNLIISLEMIYNYQWMHAAYICTDTAAIEHYLMMLTISIAHSPQATEQLRESESAANTLMMIYQQLGYAFFSEYPDNFAFEICSRLTPWYGTNHFITRLIDTCDKFIDANGPDWLTVNCIGESLVVFADNNANYFECWNFKDNVLVERVDLRATAKIILVSECWNFIRGKIIVAYLTDGTIHIYGFNKTLLLRNWGHVSVGKDLDLLSLMPPYLVCTFHCKPNTSEQPCLMLIELTKILLLTAEFEEGSLNDKTDLEPPVHFDDQEWLRVSIVRFEPRLDTPITHIVHPTRDLITFEEEIPT